MRPQLSMQSLFLYPPLAYTNAQGENLQKGNISSTKSLTTDEQFPLMIDRERAREKEGGRIYVIDEK